MRFLLLQSESGYQCNLQHLFPQQKTSSSNLMLLKFVHNLIYWTYSGVSCLLEFLCNGLVRRHDDKHLDTHVEDAHWNQVGHVVSMDRDTHSRLKKVKITYIYLASTVQKLCLYMVPVSLAVVQCAASPEGLIVVLSPANEGHGGPEGSEQPHKHSQSDGTAPLQLCPWEEQYSLWLV